jgi:hypothetical protein
MCMGAGWNGLDGQYMIGNMIGGKTGENLKRSSVSARMEKYGGAPKVEQTPTYATPREEPISALQRRR